MCKNLYLVKCAPENSRALLSLMKRLLGTSTQQLSALKRQIASTICNLKFLRILAIFILLLHDMPKIIWCIMYAQDALCKGFSKKDNNSNFPSQLMSSVFEKASTTLWQSSRLLIFYYTEHFKILKILVQLF